MAAPKRGKLNLVPAARLQKFLGRELIADPNLAIVEFVKNAYDAGATRVVIDFRIRDKDPEEQLLIISDNGSGMNYEDFKSNWMRPGYSVKAKPGKSTVRLRHGSEVEERTPIGEKGVGRLAAGRLGVVLEVFTRRKTSDAWLHVLFDWDDFDDMDTPMAQVPVLWDLDSEPEDIVFRRGTRVEIQELTLDWRQKVRGRKVFGRFDFRLGRLAQDLAILVYPLAAGEAQFSIELRCDDPSFSNVVGPITPERATFSEYDFRFQIEEGSDGRMVSRRELRRNPAIAEKVGAPRKTTTTQRWPDQTLTLQCGPIEGRLIYSPPQVHKGELGITPGVYVYRDGIRVDPYGHEGNDWIGVRAQKAKRQGHAPVQPNRLVGYVQISKDDNPDLIDMSNRQGLVENEAYEDFLAAVRREFDHFAGVIQNELVEPGWESSTSKSGRAAARAERYAQLITRSRAHAIRQPLAALSTELARLRLLTKRGRLPSDALSTIKDVEARSRTHVKAINQIVEDLIQKHQQEDAEELSLDEVVEQAVDDVTTTPTEKEVELFIETTFDETVLAPRALLTNAIAELLLNAIEAPRPAGRNGTVAIEGEVTNGEVVLLIVDNGCGFEDDSEEAFNTDYSTKGRPGVGLTLVREQLALFGGSVRVQETNESGTTVRVELPTVRSIRKEAGSRSS